MDDFQNADNTLVSNPTEITSKPAATDPSKNEKPPLVSKPVMILAVVVIVAIIGLLGYRYFKSSSDSINDNSTDIVPSEIATNDQTGMPIDPTEDSSTDSEQSLGNFTNYTLEKLNSTSGNRSLLFFSAGWCPTCKALESDIINNKASIPSNLAIFRVDYDTSSALKLKYGVTYQHTLIQVDSNGRELKRWFGSPTLKELVSQTI